MGLINSLVMPLVSSLFSSAISGLTGGAVSGGLGALGGGSGMPNPLSLLKGVQSITGGGGGGKPMAGSYQQMVPGSSGGSQAVAAMQPQFQPIPNGLNAQKEEQRQQQIQQSLPKPALPQQSLTPLMNAIFPTLSQNITSKFGNRTAPTAGASTFHQGIDIGGKAGDPLRAALSGVIQQVGNNRGMGNYMKMLADNGMTLTYGHANNFSVKPGQRINAGQNVGALGSTGISTGPHLHFMTSRNGKYIDPMELFRQKTGM